MKALIPIPTVDELQLQIANQARLSRLANGYTQLELSRKSQVSYATIRKFEHTGEISLHSLLKIASAFYETKSFQSLFPGADLFKFISPRVFKRPKLHANGTYQSSRILTPRELEKALDFEDSPNSFPIRKTQKRDWKKLPKTESTWDPFEEIEKIRMNHSQDDTTLPPTP